MKVSAATVILCSRETLTDAAAAAAAEREKLAAAAQKKERERKAAAQQADEQYAQAARLANHEAAQEACRRAEAALRSDNLDQTVRPYFWTWHHICQAHLEETSACLCACISLPVCCKHKYTWSVSCKLFILCVILLCGYERLWHFDKCSRLSDDLLCIRQAPAGTHTACNMR